MLLYTLQDARTRVATAHGLCLMVRRFGLVMTQCLQLTVQMFAMMRPAVCTLVAGAATTFPASLLNRIMVHDNGYCSVLFERMPLYS